MGRGCIVQGGVKKESGDSMQELMGSIGCVGTGSFPWPFSKRFLGSYETASRGIWLVVWFRS